MRLGWTGRLVRSERPSREASRRGGTRETAGAWRGRRAERLVSQERAGPGCSRPAGPVLTGGGDLPPQELPKGATRAAGGGAAAESRARRAA